MNEGNNYHKILTDISLQGMMRIDAALEGDCNPTVTTVWTREKGFIGFGSVRRSDPALKPSLELYFKDRWIHRETNVGGTRGVLKNLQSE